MREANKYLLVRLLPVLLLVVAAGAWFGKVQDGGPWVLRNLLPLFLLVFLAWLTLHRGQGKWSGNGFCMPLGTLGYAIPALGLAVYLHYAYTVNLDNMFGTADNPERLFQYLPIYTLVAGGIGFAIGWIVGRNV